MRVYLRVTLFLTGMGTTVRVLHVQLPHATGVGLYEVPPRLHDVAHKGSEYVVGLDNILYGDLEHGPGFGVHGRLP